LRRQVFIASQIDDARKFEFLVAQYLRRYRSSVYAGNFRQRLASALARIDFGKDRARFERVVAILNNLEQRVRRDLFLMMAKSAVEQGQLESALMSSEMALSLADDEVSAARAKLYRAAAMIVSPGALDAGSQALKSLDRSILPGQDVALLDSALSMVDQIRVQPDRAEATKPAKPPPLKVSGAVQAPEQPAAILKAREALDRVDKLIKK
jgi:chemotaxis protein MotC